MFYDLAPQNSHLFGNIYQKFKQLPYLKTDVQQNIFLYFIDNQYITRLSLDLAQIVMSARINLFFKLCLL